MKNLGIKLMLVGMLLTGIAAFTYVIMYLGGTVYPEYEALIELKTPGIICLVAGFLIPSADTIKGIGNFFKKLFGIGKKDNNDKDKKED